MHRSAVQFIYDRKGYGIILSINRLNVSTNMAGHGPPTVTSLRAVRLV